MAGRDRDIRARLAIGDEDSVFNLTLFGTTFTNQRPLTERDIADVAGGGAMPGIVHARIRDLSHALTSPAGNERLEFARSIALRQRIDLAAPDAERRLRAWLDKGTARVVAEYGRHSGLVDGSASSDAARSTLFHDRGLSSDTSIFPGFGVEQTLAVLRANGLAAAGGVHRVAIVGPGLDFADKRQGYDFYPVQTIQPFAVIDSLLRLGLALPGQVRVTTLDVSPRVNRHLGAARQRAGSGVPYVLNVPQRTDLFEWSPYLVAYWASLGDRVGTAIPPAVTAPGTVQAKMRTVSVRPDIVQAIVAADLDIVVQRLEPLGPGDLFDLIIATNVLVYYGAFEQSLALANVAAMLRPGGLFLSNQFVEASPSIPMELLGHTDIPMGTAAAPEARSSSEPVGDRFFSYRRRLPGAQQNR